MERLPFCCKYTASYCESIVAVQCSIDVTLPSVHLSICLRPSTLLSSPSFVIPQAAGHILTLDPSRFPLMEAVKDQTERGNEVSV